MNRDVEQQLEALGTLHPRMLAEFAKIIAGGHLSTARSPEGPAPEIVKRTGCQRDSLAESRRLA